MAATRKIIVKTGSDRYPVIFDSDLKTFAKIISSHRRVIIITNTKIYSLHGKKLINSFLTPHITINRLLVGDGEKYKTRRSIETLYDQLFELNAGRDDLIVAFGGGVVGDIAGFVAATYMRGMNYVQVPTTLLAMVDSAIGGKVGINHRRGKNLIGAIYQPRLVFIYPYWLTTLTKRELVCGLAEIIKTGFLTSPKLLRQACETDPSYNGRTGKTINNFIIEAAKFKTAVVSRDPGSFDLRNILNFGHTFGHAIEKVERHTHYRHGEAVLAGMVGALYLSHLTGHLDKSRLSEYLGCLSPWMNYLSNLKKPISDYLSPIQVDKKKNKGKIHFVILKKPGTVFIRPVESTATVIQAIEGMVAFVNSRGKL
jgi:3-dehydroquinate synthase